MYYWQVSVSASSVASIYWLLNAPIIRADVNQDWVRKACNWFCYTQSILWCLLNVFLVFISERVQNQSINLVSLSVAQETFISSYFTFNFTLHFLAEMCNYQAQIEQRMSRFSTDECEYQKRFWHTSIYMS